MIPTAFEPLLAPGTPYLALLHAKAPDRALALLHHAAQASPDFAADVQALLADDNWRMHLIAAAAVVVAPERCPVDALWERIEAGSWVTPQLLAAAALADPTFPVRADALLGWLLDRVTPEAPEADQREVTKAATAIAALLGKPPDDVRFRKLVAANPKVDATVATRWRAAVLGGIASMEAIGWALRARMSLTVLAGDLLEQDTDVIVNPWNRNVIPWWLLVPRGVSGAIRTHGGTGLLRELGNAPMPLGSARMTSAGRLGHRAVIHVAGIDLLWRASEASIRDSVLNACKLTLGKGFTSIAFPVIGAGAGGMNPERAESIMVETLTELDPPLDVRIVRFRPRLRPLS